MERLTKDNEAKIDEIYKAIVGSELHPDGLIQRVDKLEKFSGRMKKAIWTITGVLMSLGAILKLIEDA